MAGSKINTYGVGDVDLTNIMETEDAQRQGYHKVSLTNMDNNNEPEIASGSKIEINGALFEFTSNEAITGSPSNGYVYVKLTPSGSSVTAAFTNTPPTWDTEKGGWYESSTNNRYLNFLIIKDGSNWTQKMQIMNAAKWGGEPERINCYNYLTGSATLIFTYGSDSYFDVYKPIVVWFWGKWGIAVAYYQYGVPLNPGRYRLYYTTVGTDYYVCLQIYIESAWKTMYWTMNTNDMGGVLGSGEVYFSGVYGDDQISNLDEIVVTT